MSECYSQVALTECRPVPDFPSYEACSSGFIRNVNTGKILTNSVHGDGTGMPCVSLVRDGKVHTVETRFVIACTFMGVDFWERPKAKLEYIDGNKFNNSVSNIRIKDVTSKLNEEWRPIKGWETTYVVSNIGRVKRLQRIETYVRRDTGKEVERIVSPLIMKLQEMTDDDYWTVGLIDGDRTSYPAVHRLVAEAFIPNPNNLPFVNHKDGNKKNNNIDNLEWCTAADNMQHAIRTGLRQSYKGQDRSIKKILCVETNKVYDNLKIASQETGIPYSYISSRVDTEKECHGFHFKRISLDRRIKCIDTGVIYDSPQHVLDKLGFSPQDAIKTRSCIHGLTFCYMRELPEDEEAYMQECRNRYSKWSRAERIWEDS